MGNFILQRLADGSYAIGLPNQFTDIPGSEWFYQEFAGSNLWLYYDAYSYNYGLNEFYTLTVQRSFSQNLRVLRNVPWNAYHREYETHFGRSYIIINRENGVRKYFDVPQYGINALEVVYRKYDDLLHHLTAGRIDKFPDLDVHLVSGDVLFEDR